MSPLAGYPRVYALALTLVAHTDSELDETRITRFVQAFQEVAPLTIGELWALPTMLRLVLLENLRRLAEQMLWGWERSAERGAEVRWSATTTQARNLSATGLAPAGELSDPFVVRLMQLLRDQGPAAAAAWRHLEAELAARGLDADEILRREHRRQAANQVTVGNCVLSLRLLSAIDWNSFFEHSSLVEKILRDDPGGVYPQQDFATSDRYRKAVETIARGSDADELEVARQVRRAGASRPRTRPRRAGTRRLLPGRPRAKPS